MFPCSLFVDSNLYFALVPVYKKYSDFISESMNTTIQKYLITSKSQKVHSSAFRKYRSIISYLKYQKQKYSIHRNMAPVNNTLLYVTFIINSDTTMCTVNIILLL